MTDIENQIKSIEEEIRKTPYHKGTEHYIGKLRAKISRLKSKLLESQSKKSGGGGGYSIKKQGDATLVLVGPPSVGKSTLLNRLTNAKSKVAPYAFTTVSVIPGMMHYKDAKIQILDVPGLIEGAAKGKGRGREVLSVARGADLIIILTDVENIKLIDDIKKSLYENGIRLNIVRPYVIVDKKPTGGIKVSTNIKQGYSKDTIKEIANELGIKNAEIILNEEMDINRLIDALSINRVYVPSINLVNKIDMSKNSQQSKDNENILFISAEKNINIDKLKEIIWDKLEFLRIYLVRKDEHPSNKNPLVVKKETDLKKVAEIIGSEFSENISRAKIWGTGAKFDGQEVSLSMKVEEGMQVRFI